MKVLGIDPSLTSTGLGLIEAGPQGSLLALKKIKTSPKDSMVARTTFLFNQVQEFLIEHDPDLVVVEDIRINARAMAKNGDATNKTIRAQQTVVLAAATMGYQVLEAEATKWRAILKCGGASRAVAKANVREFVNKKFEADLDSLGIHCPVDGPLNLKLPGIKKTDDDLSDAVGIALTGQTLLKHQ